MYISLTPPLQFHPHDICYVSWNVAGPQLQCCPDAALKIICSLGCLRLVSCIQLFILESIASCSSLVPAATSEKPSVRLVIWRKLFPCWSLTIPPASSTILNVARNDSAVITSPLSI